MIDSESQFVNFWQRLFQNELSQVQGPESSSGVSEEGGKSGAASNKDWPDMSVEDDSNDLIKFKTQLGVINKLKVTVLIA